MSDRLPNGVWLTDDSLVYILEDTADMIGKGADYRPRQRNRFWFNVYAHQDHPQTETVGLAERIAKMLNDGVKS